MPQILTPTTTTPSPAPGPAPAPAPAPAPSTSPVSSGPFVGGGGTILTPLPTSGGTTTTPPVGGGTTTTTTTTPLPGGGSTVTVVVTPNAPPVPLALAPNITSLAGRGTAILGIVQSFCREYALPVPGALQGSQDGGALQFRELLQTIGEDIWTSSEWQECKRLVTFTTVRGADQGDIHIICPANLAYIIPESFWDNTLRVMVAGPLTTYEWQVQRSQISSGNPVFRIAANRLEMNATTRENHLMSLVYKSRDWLYTEASVTNDRITTDRDVSFFSDTLMKRGLRAFWLRAKQMPHALEMQMYVDLKQQEGAMNAVKPVLQIDGESRRASAGITIPIGSWTK